MRQAPAISVLWHALVASSHESAVHAYVSAQFLGAPTQDADPLHESDTVQ